ncbi:MAG: DUF3368 domain-containing protein [Phaeodactylibacter sp.]|nr:DUF3368 domain-containing protein [Phaeodactylibacter sp.]
MGVLIKAKEIGVIENVKPIIAELEKFGFRISATLKEKILSKVDES